MGQGGQQLPSGVYYFRVDTAGGAKLVSFDHAIIAAGSHSARLPGLPYDDPRLVDSTGALELARLTGSTQDARVRELVGEELCQILRGEVSLAVDPEAEGRLRLKR